MKFERSELGTLFSKLRTAVPEVRAVGTNDAGILLSGSNAYATNLELSVRAGLSKPVEQDVVVPPRGVDFISGTGNQHRGRERHPYCEVRHSEGTSEHYAGRELPGTFRSR